MKKWLVVLIAMMIIVVGCSNEEPTVEEQVAPDVKVDDVVGNDETETEDTPATPVTFDTPEAAANNALTQFKQAAALKFTLGEITQHHPELDVDEQVYKMTYAPAQSFMYQQYEDNYNVAKYESYAVEDGKLYIKNEYGPNEWVAGTSTVTHDDQLQQQIAALLEAIIAKGEDVTMTEELGENVIFMAAPSANFAQLEQLYHSMKQSLDEIAISEQLLEKTEEPYSYNFTNASLEMRLNDQGLMNSYNIMFEFSPEEQNFKMLEQIFHNIDTTTDFTLPADIS